jgi:pimeloyl-ACP methyl ester carboxylesterase
MGGFGRLAAVCWLPLLWSSCAFGIVSGPTTPVDDANQLIANANVLPYIVLVPGALGSRIQACGKNSDICETIWGGVVDTGNYSLIIDDDASDYRTSVIDKLAFFDIYQPIIAYIQKSYERFRSQRLIGFAYDWRRSVADSAKRLKARICEIVDRSPDAHFVLIGHSMGGLIVKQWMREFSGPGCAAHKPISVDHAIFVATPHAGAAVVLDSVVDGYSMFASKTDNFLKRMIAQIGDKLFARAIDEGGLTFDSTFDLLPIASSARCRQSPSPPNPDIGVFVGNQRSINVFDATYWNELGLLNRHGDASAVRALLAQLKSALARADQEMCDLRNYDPSKTARKVTYLVGQLEDKDWRGRVVGVNKTLTISRVTLVPQGNGRPDVRVGTWAGDGTVDIRSAGNDGIRGPGDDLRFTDSKHKDTINSLEMQKLVDEIFVQAEQAAAAQVASATTVSAEYVAETAEQAASQDAIVSTSRNPDEWSEPSNVLADAINRAVTEHLGIDGTEAYRLAKAEADPIQRLALYSLSAKLNEDNPLLKAWSLTRAAHLAFELADYQAALGNVAAALLAVEGVSGPPAVEIRRKLSSTLRATQNKLNPPANS